MMDGPSFQDKLREALPECTLTIAEVPSKKTGNAVEVVVDWFGPTKDGKNFWQGRITCTISQLLLGNGNRQAVLDEVVVAIADKVRRILDEQEAKA